MIKTNDPKILTALSILSNIQFVEKWVRNYPNMIDQDRFTEVIAYHMAIIDRAVARLQKK